MTDDELLAALTAAVRAETENPGLVLSPANTASDVPGWDSLTHVRIMLAVEMALNISLDISETYHAANIGELLPILRAAPPA